MTADSINRSLTCPGQARLLDHMASKSITRSEAMEAKCFECMAGYADGRKDCHMPACPLYPWMPYRENKATKPKRERTEKQKANDARLRAMWTE